MTKKMKDLLLESAAEILGSRRKINKPWATNDILDLCDTRWELKKMKKADPGVAWQHSNVNRNITSRKRMKQT